MEESEYVSSIDGGNLLAVTSTVATMISNGTSLLDGNGVTDNWLNETLNGTDPVHFLMCPSTKTPLLNLVFMLLYSVVGIVGLLGNTLVIYVVLRFSNMQTVTNM